MTDLNFINKVEEKRKELGLTIAELCKELNVIPKTYFIWKEGRGPRDTTKVGVLKTLKDIEAKKLSTGLVLLDSIRPKLPKDKQFTAKEARMLAKNAFLTEKIIHKDADRDEIKRLNKAIKLSARTDITSRNYEDTELIKPNAPFLDWQDFLAFIRKIEELSKQ